MIGQIIDQQPDACRHVGAADKHGLKNLAVQGVERVKQGHEPAIGKRAAKPEIAKTRDPNAVERELKNGFGAIGLGRSFTAIWKFAPSRRNGQTGSARRKLKFRQLCSIKSSGTRGAPWAARYSGEATIVRPLSPSRCAIN